MTRPGPESAASRTGAVRRQFAIYRREICLVAVGALHVAAESRDALQEFLRGVSPRTGNLRRRFGPEVVILNSEQIELDLHEVDLPAGLRLGGAALTGI